MCIEYNKCHYGGMYNINVKRIFVITEIVRMNEKTGTGVSSDKEKVKESQSRRVTPPLDTPFGCRVGGITDSGPAHEVCTFSSRADDLLIGEILPVIHSKDSSATWSTSIHSVI